MRGSHALALEFLELDCCNPIFSSVVAVTKDSWYKLDPVQIDRCKDEGGFHFISCFTEFCCQQGTVMPGV